MSNSFLEELAARFEAEDAIDDATPDTAVPAEITTFGFGSEPAAVTPREIEGEPYETVED